MAKKSKSKPADPAALKTVEELRAEGRLSNPQASVTPPEQAMEAMNGDDGAKPHPDAPGLVPVVQMVLDPKVALKSPNGQTSDGKTGSGTGPVTGPGALREPLTGPAPHGAGQAPRRMAFFKLLTRDGMSAKAASRALMVSWPAARRHVDSLLSAGAIELRTDTLGARGAKFYRLGPKAPAWMAAATGPVTGPVGEGVALPALPPSHATGPVRPGLLVDPHAGTVKVPVTVLPEDPSLMPGCYSAKEPNGVRCWWFKVVDDGRNLWRLQLNAAKHGGGTLLITPPKVRTRNLVAALDVEGRQRVAHKLAQAWGEPHGLVMEPVAQMAKPVEYAMPGMPFQSTAGIVSGNRLVSKDDTPHPDSLESQDRAIVQAVSTLPEDMASTLAGIGRLEARMEVVVQAEVRMAKLWEKQVGFNQDVVAVQVAQAQASSPRQPAPAPVRPNWGDFV